MQKTPSCRKRYLLSARKSRAGNISGPAFSGYPSEGHARPALFPRGRETQQPAPGLNIIAVVASGTPFGIRWSMANTVPPPIRGPDILYSSSARMAWKSPRSTNLSMPPLKASLAPYFFAAPSYPFPPPVRRDTGTSHRRRGSRRSQGSCFHHCPGRRSLLRGSARNSIFFDSTAAKTLQSAPGRTEGRTFPPCPHGC